MARPSVAAVLVMLWTACGNPIGVPGAASPTRVAATPVVWPTNCAAPPAANPGAVAGLVAGNTQLAVNLFRQVAGSANGSNVFVSPYSVSTALGMTYAGAAGLTASQMAQTLQLPASAQTVAPANGALDCQLMSDGASAGTLNIADALFGEATATFEPPFLSLLQTDYGAPLQQLDFAGDPSGAEQTINQWVSNQTNAYIPQLLPPGEVTPATKIMLVNAIYFHGSWANAFDPANTAPQTFQVSATQSVQTPFMNAAAMSAGYYQGAGFAMLESQYVGGQLAMDFLLPDQVDGLPALEASLTPANLATWLGGLAVSTIQVSLPKLSLDTAENLIPPFEALGLTLPFSPGADFSGIDGQTDIVLGVLLQQAVLQVDESGATAVAATAIGNIPECLGSACGGPSFVADHPFLLLIRDLPTGSLLFMGQVTNPASS